MQGRALLGERRWGKLGNPRESPLTPGTCTPTLPPDSSISRLGVSSTPGSGNWKDTAAQGHTVSEKPCQGLSQGQSDFKTHPPASVLRSLHKEALKKSMWNYIRNQEFAYLKLVAETTANAARKEEQREPLFHQNTLSLVKVKERVGLWIPC